MEKHLIINMEGPLMSFGGVAIDGYGMTEPFPGKAMITGLIGNALGYRRQDHEKLQALQDRMVMAARIDQEPPGGINLTDFQTAKMGPGVDIGLEAGKWIIGWTTRGRPETRSGDLKTYQEGSGERRWRDYRTDTKVTVALRMEGRDRPGISLTPSLDEMAKALDEPERPLFIGRKSCLPWAPLFGGFEWAENTLAAVLAVPLDDNPGYLPPRVRLQWDQQEEGERPAQLRTVQMKDNPDSRNWRAGSHGGRRPVVQGTIPREYLARKEEQPVG